MAVNRALGQAWSSPVEEARTSRGLANVARTAVLDPTPRLESGTARLRRPATNLLLTISEVADLLGIHKSTLYRTIGRSELPLPVIRVGATMRVPRAAIERMLAGERTTQVPAPAITVTDASDFAERASYCSACGAPFPASSRPTCSAARRSSSPTESV